MNIADMSLHKINERCVSPAELLIECTQRLDKAHKENSLSLEPTITVRGYIPQSRGWLRGERLNPSREVPIRRYDCWLLLKSLVMAGYGHYRSFIEGDHDFNWQMMVEVDGKLYYVQSHRKMIVFYDVFLHGELVEVEPVTRELYILA